MRLTWWDARNWGVEGRDTRDGSPWSAGQLALWYRALADLFADYGLSAPGVTAGAWALRAWRQVCDQRGVYIHCHPGALALEAACYHGGRCEAWHVGPTPAPAVMLDVRSAYLHAAQSDCLPVRLERYYHGREAAAHLDPCDLLWSCARVLVETDTPVVPVHTADGVIYPVGRFWACLPGPELRLVHQRGRILRVSEVARYETAPVLRRWSEVAYRLRCAAERTGVPGAAAAVKTAGVALVGKLGQRARTWTRVPGQDDLLQYGESWATGLDGLPTRWRWVSGYCWRQDDHGWAPAALPAVAAWVTSLARVRLWHLTEAAYSAPVWYLDTDCLITDCRGLGYLQEQGLVQEHALGALSIRHGPADCVIGGPKCYQIGSTCVNAGRVRGVLTRGADGRSHWYTPSARDQVRARHAPGTWSCQVPPDHHTPTVSGRVWPDGHVDPIALWEDVYESGY